MSCNLVNEGATLPFGANRRNKMVTRREFLDTLVVGAAGLAIASTAKSYSQILGANDRLNFAIIGLNGRGYAHLASLKANQDTARISHVCDVDGDILKKFAGDAERELGYAPATDRDFRHVLQSKDVDAITIATPDHWPSPACGRASMSTLKSHAATIPPRAYFWFRLSGSTENSYRWVISGGQIPWSSRPLTKFTMD
jgi:hypothetical protein